MLRWTERQRALLAEIGLRPWGPVPAAAESPASADAAPPPLLVREPPADSPASPARSPALALTLTLTPAPAPAPPSAAVDALDWAALRDAVSHCRACGLCQGRRQPVFGVGHAQAHCMVVGEAPGEQEDRVGEPFVGPAGQLLDQMLAAIGLTRASAPPERQVYIANTVKCRPPRNRNPSPDELAHCAPFLARQVALVQPRVVLAMGRFAVQSLLGSDEPIGRLRGRVHRWQGRALVVTYHPAYLLRQPADKARVWDDLCLAAECLAAGDANT